MIRTLLKSKVHRATVTGADLHYEGSITVDTRLMEAADIVPNEQVQVYNISTGSRFTTYAIPGQAGEVRINGAAAHLASEGDLVIIASYAAYSEDERERHRPRVVQVDERNRVRRSHARRDTPAEVGR